MTALQALTLGCLLWTVWIIVLTWLAPNAGWAYRHLCRRSSVVVDGLVCFALAGLAWLVVGS